MIHKSICVPLLCDDFEVARDFYTRALAFSVDLFTETSVGGERLFRMTLVSGPDHSIVLDFSLRKPGQPVGAGILFTLQVDDVARARERLTRLDGKTIVKFHPTPFADFLDIRDPTGNLIQLRS